MRDSVYIDGQMPTPERQAELLRKIADQIVKRKLTVPAIMFFESVKPLSFVGSQALVFLQPIVQAFLNRKEYDEIVLMMEERENVEKLLLEIERQEAEWQERERAEKAEIKRQKAERKAQGPGPSEGWWQRLMSSLGLGKNK